MMQLFYSFKGDLKMVTKKITTLSLALLLSSGAYNVCAEEEVLCDTPVEVQAVEPVVTTEQTPLEQSALSYENIDALCKSKGIIISCSWLKKENTDATVWKNHLESMFETAQTEPSPHFADLLGLITKTDSSMPHNGQLVLSQEKLEQDQGIKRTKKEDIDFPSIAQANDQVQFTIRVNADEYTPENWKLILTRIIDFADRKNVNPEDETLTISALLSSLDEVERAPVEVVDTVVAMEEKAVETL